MNERIRELATEVGISVDYLNNTKQIVLLDKFAELIIKECADIASINQFQHDAVGNYVLNHFGIEK